MNNIDVKKVFKDNEQRFTKAREEMWNLFLQNPNQHLTIEEIINFLETKEEINVATTYNNLSTFLELNFINEFIYKNKKYYEYITNNHGHFFCLKCYNLFNVDIVGLSCLNLEIKQKYGATVLTNVIEFKGICNDCQEHDEFN